jgi:hypothetical protein
VRESRIARSRVRRSIHPRSAGRAAGASVFGEGVNIDTLLKAAEGTEATTKNAFIRLTIVDAGHTIGHDILTGKPTSVYTVVTTAADVLITIHPGMPK